MVVSSCSESMLTWRSKWERLSEWRAIRPWLIRTKIVKNTLSKETNKARTPNGNGSKAFNPGITWRFATHHAETRSNWAIRNPTLPTSFVITSLTRSVGVLRSRASCSSLAMASMLYCVGFAAARRGSGLSIRFLPQNVLEDGYELLLTLLDPSEAATPPLLDVM